MVEGEGFVVAVVTTQEVWMIVTAVVRTEGGYKIMLVFDYAW